MEEKKFCKFCGEQIDKDSVVCSKCGRQLKVIKKQEKKEVSENKKEKQKKFYEQEWFMWLTLVFFAPVGIFLMWKFNTKFQKKTKIILTIVFAIFFLFITGGSDETTTVNNSLSNNSSNTTSSEVSKNKVEVIDFSSMKEHEILAWCNDNNLSCNFKREYSNSIAKDDYIKQSVNAGKQVIENTKITITFSLGKEPKIYTSGSYKVGKDLEAGKYIIEGSGYLEVCTTSNCSILDGELLYNDNFSNKAIVILNNGEYLKFSRGKMYHSNEYNYSLSTAFIKPGYFEIGKDLEAGEYRLEGKGYYAVCSKPSCDIMSGELIKNENITNGDYVSVKNGQYLIISGNITGSK